MRITEAARRLGTSPRMLRYREALGLLPPTKEDEGKHRQFGEDELRAVSLTLALERRYDVSPAELAFGLRVLTEPEVRGSLLELGQRIGRVRPSRTRALDFEKEKAMRLLGRRDGGPGSRRDGGPGPAPRRSVPGRGRRY